MAHTNPDACGQDLWAFGLNPGVGLWRLETYSWLYSKLCPETPGWPWKSCFFYLCEMKMLLELHVKDLFPVLILKVTFIFPRVFCAWALSPAAVRWCSCSSPEAVWDWKKSRLEFHQALSKKTSKCRGFLILMSGNMLSWNTTCPRHTGMRWLSHLYLMFSPSNGKMIPFKKHFDISKWKVHKGIICVVVLAGKKNWMHKQMEWEEMWKQWEEKNCFSPYRVVIDSWKQKDNSSLYSFQTTVRIFTSS